MRNDLLVSLGEISYYRGVTPDQFWKEVGAKLAEQRMRKGMSPGSLEAKGGPTNKTVTEIEAGRIGRISSLIDLLDALHIDMVDLFRSVLKMEKEESSPELQFVIRQFKDAGVAGRAALVSTARLAEVRSESRAPEEPSDQPNQKQGTTREGIAAAKRRGRR